MGHDGAMPQAIGAKYSWMVFVTWMKESDTPTLVSKELAKGLTRFTKACYSECKHPDKFTSRNVLTKNAKPLNYYLLDEVCVILLQRTNAGKTLDEVKADDELLSNFFGTAEHGRIVLEDVDEEDWEEAGEEEEDGDESD